MPSAIRVENLSKCYRISQAGARGSYRTIRESLMEGASGAFRRIRRGASRGRSEEFRALDGVDFEVQPGEVVGVIGRNGAGKSTLLKILSRITEPTSGRVLMRGRVGSLLEVGTGFHPELTGRENVFLNGAILGMTRREIAKRFDEIVAFSEVERFLDTPVKRYSSGMYVRLAFAVAAHLEPEILIVDEVLAVGDASFQKKCLGKMRDVATGGRTVFFVSHQMESVRKLCTSVIWLDRGRVAAIGPRDRVIASYLSAGAQAIQAGIRVALKGAHRIGNGSARFTDFRVMSGHAGTADQPYPDGPLEITMGIESDSSRSINSLAVVLSDRFGSKLVNTDTLEIGESIELRAGRNDVCLRIDQLHLKPGIYTVGLWMADAGECIDHVEAAGEIEIVDSPEGGRGMRPKSDGLVTSDFQIRVNHK